MADELVQVTIAITDPEASPEELEETLLGLRDEAEAISGVEQVQMVSATELPEGAKGDGGALAEIVASLPFGQVLLTLVKVLAQRRFGTQTVKLRVKEGDREVDVEVARLEDLEPALEKLQKFMERA